MKGWRRALLWSGSVVLIVSTMVVAAGIALVDTEYSPVNFHGPHRVIIWAYFTALWLFFPSVLLVVLGAVLVRRSDSIKQNRDVSPL
jgi:hypothetical protein